MTRSCTSRSPTLSARPRAGDPDDEAVPARDVVGLGDEHARVRVERAALGPDDDAPAAERAPAGDGTASTAAPTNAPWPPSEPRLTTEWNARRWPSPSAPFATARATRAPTAEPVGERSRAWSAKKQTPAAARRPRGDDVVSRLKSGDSYDAPPRQQDKSRLTHPSPSPRRRASR